MLIYSPSCDFTLSERVGIGTVVANDTEVYEAKGALTQLCVAAGDAVERGQLLYELDGGSVEAPVSGTLKGFRQTIEVPSSAMAELIEDGIPVRYLYTPREAQARVDSSHVGNSIREILGVPRMRRAFAKAMRDCFRWRDDEVTLYRDFGTSFFFRTRSGCPECGGLILHESTRKTPKGVFPEMYYGVHT